MSLISVQYDNVESYVSISELSTLISQLKYCHNVLMQGKGHGSDYLGWLRLPSETTEESLAQIKAVADEVRKSADVFVCVGVGGSCLGARAGVELLGQSKGLKIIFTGNDVASESLRNILNDLGDRRICVNVISKSGNTMEPILTFRFLKEVVEKRHGRVEAGRRIFVTTRPEGGALNKLACKEGYRRFVVPDEIGGRFSILSPVGLLPMSVAGVDIHKIIEGAREIEESANQANGIDDQVWLYSALRETLRRKGKTIEVMASFQPGMRYLLEWWKQLAGESEGKKGKGLFPASVQYTADLHSFGQWAQEGPRSLFETFLWVEPTGNSLTVPFWQDNTDGLNFLEGLTLEEINRKAYEATAEAHLNGGVPNLTIRLEEGGARGLGGLFYFFQRTVALTGYLMDINPFDQPGVEMYKKNMFNLLKKPGYEKGV